MKPAPFLYHAPGTLEEALALLAEHGPEAKPLAGGQSLVPAMNFRLAQPAVLVDLNRIPDLTGIRPTGDGGLRLGAMVRHSALERDAQVRARVPLLAEAVPWIAHPPIRNRGTLGGSLAHADPAAELPAVMVALGARCRLRSASAERWVEAGDFFTGLFATALEPGELLVEVEVPAMAAGTGWAFEELARRHGDFALAGVAVMVHRDAAGTCLEVRVVLLGVGEGPVMARQAAASLTGQQPNEIALRAAAAAAAAEIDPPGDIHASPEYRRHLAGVLTRRALSRAALNSTASPKAPKA
jgi:carbon-monoxide dehydrogenase medium subunit